MLPTLIANQTIVRLRGAVSTDGNNDQFIDWSTPVALSIAGCSVQPVRGVEVLLGRDAVESRWNLYAPLTADIESTDRIRHSGVDYEVDGSVQDWPDLFGLGHRQALLRRVEG